MRHSLRRQLKPMPKATHFLAGLPRTGSTLLGSIMAQNPLIHVTPTSPLCPLLSSISDTFRTLDNQYTFDHDKISRRIYRSTISAFHKDVKQPIILDKHRAWPKYVPAIKQYLSKNPKIICTVRPVPEIIASYLKLAELDENNFIDTHLKKLNEIICHESRANLLWQFYIKPVYDGMMEGLALYPESVLLIEYRDLVFHPKRTLESIYKFCELAPFEHSLTGIENRCAEDKDDAWGMKNLHVIRPSLKMESISPAAYLPQPAIKYFEQFDVRRTA